MRALLLLCVCLGAACAARQHVVVAAAPACTATVDPETARISVNGVDLDIAATNDDAHVDGAEAHVWPLGPRSILLAWTGAGGRFDPYGSDTLWEVSCAPKVETKAFFTEEGADFGDAALSADGRTLFYTGVNAVTALDLATKQVRQISTPPAMLDCEGEKLPVRDVVMRLDPVKDVLTFKRGVSCNGLGFRATAVTITHPGAPGAKEVQPHVRRPFVAVASDRSGAVWAGEPTCEENSGFWKSSDHGNTWERVTVDGMDSGAQVIVVDEKRAGNLIVISHPCEDEARGAWGGRPFITRDGGESWLPLDLPDDLVAGDNGQDLNIAITFTGGSIDRLALWGTVIDAETNERHSGRWESSDGGASWYAADVPLQRPQHQSTSASSGKWVFRASDDGLVREGAKVEKLFPTAPEDAGSP
jgi:hypothetical protein